MKLDRNGIGLERIQDHLMTGQNFLEELIYAEQAFLYNFTFFGAQLSSLMDCAFS